jgi:N-methylhydantoinase B
MTAEPSVDTITYEVVRGYLIATVAEIKSTVTRTACSHIVAMAGDLSTAIADRNGRVVAQGQDNPAQLGALRASLLKTLAAFDPAGLRPGDVLVSNDPYLAGSNHLNDVIFVMPVFVENAIVAYSLARAHWADIGGMAPGGFSVTVWDIYSEGHRIPPIRLFRNYEADPGLLSLILANVRNRREREWDANAQFAGCRVGEQRVRELCSRYGAPVVMAVMERMLDASEKEMRRHIQAIPDGVYEGTDYIEGDGWTDDLIPMRARVEVRGDSVSIDYSGSATQVRGGVNAAMAVTDGMSKYVLKAMTDPAIAYNDGVERAITVSAPPGCVLNPSEPAACSTGGNGETSFRLADMLLEIMSQAAPDRVIAGSHASASTAVFCAQDPDARRQGIVGRDRIISVEVHAGGMGARPTKDGINGIRMHGGNAMTMTVEYLEYTTPVRVLAWEIVPDTGGAGRWRGGCATRRSYEILADDTIVTFVGERARVPPFGLFGGHPGKTARASVHLSGKGDAVLSAKGPPFVMNRGDRLVIQTSGGGGYGEPKQRTPQALSDDVRNGYVTSES